MSHPQPYQLERRAVALVIAAMVALAAIGAGSAALLGGTPCDDLVALVRQLSAGDASADAIPPLPGEVGTVPAGDGVLLTHVLAPASQQVDAYVPVAADLAPTGACVDLAFANEPLAFVLAADDRGQLLLRVEDGSEHALELYGPDGEVAWELAVDLGAGAPGDVARELEASLSEARVVVSRPDVTSVTVDRSTGEPLDGSTVTGGP